MPYGELKRQEVQRFATLEDLERHNCTIEEMEEALISQVLKETGGNRKETARRLGIGERTLYRKLAKYNLR